jgi:hypothetical protein
MGRTPEGKVKDKVKAVLKEFGLYYHMPVLNGMGEPTLDFLACGEGLFISIETKAAGKVPTPRQQITIAQMRAAGAFVFVVSCDEELARLRETLVALFRFPK